MTRSLTLAAVMAAAVGASAHAAIIAPGEYRLHNHPDGNANPPAYGLKLDDLYQVTPGAAKDIFTFDFDHAQSDMRMIYTGTTIRIFGVTWGGRDTGGSYANDIYRGLYTVDFTYSLGLSQVPGDDDLWVNGVNQVNTGTITTTTGEVVQLWDEGMGSYTFRLGDENNDAGHRGFDGVSGWGWLNYRIQNVHVADSDFLFTVGELVPAPGALALLGLGGLTVARRRR